MSPFVYEKARLREALKNLQEAWEGFFCPVVEDAEMVSFSDPWPICPPLRVSVTPSVNVCGKSILLSIGNQDVTCLSKAELWQPRAGGTVWFCCGENGKDIPM